MRQGFSVVMGGLFIALWISGCGTVRTVPSLYVSDSPKILSGTRLNLRTLAGEYRISKKFELNPPRYPLIDLPFSLAADMLLLPVTGPTGTYEWLFEP